MDGIFWDWGLNNSIVLSRETLKCTWVTCASHASGRKRNKVGYIYTAYYSSNLRAFIFRCWEDASFSCTKEAERRSSWLVSVSLSSPIELACNTSQHLNRMRTEVRTDAHRSWSDDHTKVMQQSRQYTHLHTARMFSITDVTKSASEIESESVVLVPSQ